MPTIPNFTATQGPGTIQARTVTPDSFGAQAFAGVGRLGEGFTEIAAHAQHAQDQLDLVRLNNDYQLQLDEATNTIAKNPDTERHQEMLQEVTQKLQDNLMKNNPRLSSSVQTTFLTHAAGLDGQAAIGLAHEGAKIKVQRALTDFSRTQDSLIDKAANAMSPAEEAQHLGLLDGLRQNMVKQGVMSATEALNQEDSAMNRYWTIMSQKHPDRILSLQAEQAAGATHIAGMDNAKFNQYVNTAVNTLHQRQTQEDAAGKAAEASIKRKQEVTAASATASVLRGQPVDIASLVADRSLDDSVGRTLADIQKKDAHAQNPALYQRGLAAQTEAMLSQLKYDNKPLGRNVQASITDDYLHDRITKDEYGHLMSVYQSVDDYKHQEGKEQGNQDVSHANGNLKHELKTTGPADKYDALSEQTIVSADQFFWRKMSQNPNADPWQVAKEASAIFKPVIEKRLGVSKQDKAQLDDAQMQGLVHTKTISPAAHQAYKNKEQETEGWRIVQEAIANLPPPPPPGYFERLMGLLPSTKKAEAKPRKQPGVMGE